MESAGDRSIRGADLGECAAGESHGLLGAGLDFVVSCGIGVTACLGAVEDSGAVRVFRSIPIVGRFDKQDLLRFGLVVLSSACDDTALDTEGSAISTVVSGDNGDFAMGRDERGGDGQGHEKNVGV